MYQVLGERQSLLNTSKRQIPSVLPPWIHSGLVECQTLTNRLYFLFQVPWPWLENFLAPLSSSRGTDTLIDTYLHGPQVIKGRVEHNRFVTDEALISCLWQFIHGKNLWRVQLKKALSQKGSFYSFQQALNQTLKDGKKTHTPNP